MAPEVVKAQEYNEKCDMWSCGVMCYALLAGELPFNGPTRAEVIESIKKGEVVFDCMSDGLPTL